MGVMIMKNGDKTKRKGQIEINTVKVRERNKEITKRQQ